MFYFSRPRLSCISCFTISAILSFLIFHRSYEAFGVNFLNLVKEKCRPSFYRFLQKQVLWSDSRDMNPFCNDEQIRYGK